MPIKSFKDIQAYQLAYACALEVSRLTKKFPPLEQVELARQLRRSSRSVPANIVEGWAKRASVPEFKRYLQVAFGSCQETKMWLEMSRDEGYCSSKECGDLLSRYDKIAVMIQNLWRQWRALPERVSRDSAVKS